MKNHHLTLWPSYDDYDDDDDTMMILESSCEKGKFHDGCFSTGKLQRQEKEIFGENQI